MRWKSLLLDGVRTNLTRRNKSCRITNGLLPLSEDTMKRYRSTSTYLYPWPGRDQDRVNRAI